MATRAESGSGTHARARDAARNAEAGDATGSVQVEVAWVDDAGGVERRRVALDAGTTIGGALDVLAIPERERLRTAIDAGTLRTAIYGRLCSEDTALHDGDRIELVGELAADPKLARRARVQQRRARSPKGGWGGGR